jgi:hypothetical protein
MQFPFLQCIIFEANMKENPFTPASGCSALVFDMIPLADTLHLKLPVFVKVTGL